MLMITIGLDIGSVGTKAVLWNGIVLDRVIMPTGWNPRESGMQAFMMLLTRNKLAREDVSRIVVTGYGRRTADFADAAVTEITCHAAGARFLHPNAQAVLDIGGQDSKAIALDEDGSVREFVMNDKCAAGTGRFLQVTAHLLEYDLDDFSRIPPETPLRTISSMCTVFAESEIIGLLAHGVDKVSLAMGLLDAVASRAFSMLQKVGATPPVAFTGGVAQSRSLVALLEKRIGGQLNVSPDSQLAGAIGAAVIASRRN